MNKYRIYLWNDTSVPSLFFTSNDKQRLKIKAKKFAIAHDMNRMRIDRVNTKDHEHYRITDSEIYSIRNNRLYYIDLIN